jgi:DNA (cytosine-5)-methyltransferase 1
MSRPKLLDLFCCEGGASMGYWRSGFDVYGVDIVSQPRYPFPFHRGDALSVMQNLLDGHRVGFGVEVLELSDFAAIHASPPCQARTKAQKIRGNEHPLLIAPTRFLLNRTGLPYVIENVVPDDDELDPLIDPVTLCGGMFGIETYRHRQFETNWDVDQPPHPEHLARTTKMGRPPQEGEFMHIVGNFSGVARGREVMGMPWASRDGLREAIPPAYTEFIGAQLLESLGVAA